MCVCCSLVSHVHAFTVAKGFLGRSLKWKRKTGQFISLCQIIFSMFTCAWSHWPQPWKCCRNLMGRKQLPKVKPQVYILCFTKMKNLRRAVNPRPQWSPSDLESPQRTHETCIVSMHHRDTPYQSFATVCKGQKSIPISPNGAWQVIDFRLSKISILPYRGDGARVTEAVIFFQANQKGNVSLWPLIWEGSFHVINVIFENHLL